MRAHVKFKLAVIFSIILISSVAVGGAVFLGNYYLKIVRDGYIPKNTKVNSQFSKSVASERHKKMLLLNPVPVYYLQVGVFSDKEGAVESAKAFSDLGYRPYITKNTPHRIWLGVCQNRSDTEAVKRELKDKGFGSFTGSVVINGTNLKYDTGSEVFIKAVTPILETHTKWLEKNLNLFQKNEVETINWSLVDSLLAEGKENTRLETAKFSNNDSVNRRLEDTKSAKLEYDNQLAVLKQQRNQDNYLVLQYKFLEFVDNYILLWQEIGNICKT